MVSAGNSQSSPPEAGELEVSVFGPGFGECIVLHLGVGQWAVVDSCLDPVSKRPAALHYLESLGVEVAKAVCLIVGTHWHDDHMHGISAVFREAKQAVFACTEAVLEPDFEEVLGAWLGTRSLAGGSGVNELRSILAALKERSRGTNYPMPRLASANKVLWERLVSPCGRVRALSPSDAAVVVSMARLRTMIPRTSRVRRRLPNIQPNDASVAVSVTVGQQHVLLGADLQVRADRGLGWFAILDTISSEAARHHGFKVAHHGSPNADHPDIWRRMLVQEPWAVTTPFVSGNVRLPSGDDCQRILGQTCKAYLTASPHPTKFRDPDRAVQKTVTEATVSAHFVPGKYGHVRLRKRIEDSTDEGWQVELFGNALRMDDHTSAT